jgi:hypothetical protein
LEADRRVQEIDRFRRPTGLEGEQTQAVQGAEMTRLFFQDRPEERLGSGQLARLVVADS